MSESRPRSPEPASCSAAPPERIVSANAVRLRIRIEHAVPDEREQVGVHAG